MFALAACQKELQQPVEEQKPVLEGIEGELQEVTFSVNLEDKSQTKAISDGLSADRLEYAVYYAEQGTLDGEKNDVNHSSKYQPGDYIEVLSTGNNAKIEKNGERTWKVTLTLAKNVKYDIVFWADNSNSPYVFDEENAQIIVSDNYTGAANAENRDAFYGICKGYSVISSDERVELRRPFAQINFGACDYIPYVTDLGLVVTSTIDTDAHEAVEAVYEYDDPVNGRLLYPARPAVAKCTVPNTLNVLDGSVSGDAVVNFQLADIPFKGGDEVLLNAKTDDGEIPYHWMGMNYILAGAEATINNIHATFHYNGQDLTFDVPNVPYKRNYKTNILGNLFTESAKFNVVVVPEYFTPDVVIDLDELAALNPIERAIKLAVDGKLSEASVVLSEDIAIEKTIEVPAGLKLVLDLGGKTLTSTVTTAILAEGNVTISNGNVQVAKEFVRAGAGVEIALNGVKAVSGTDAVAGDNCVFVPAAATDVKVIVDAATELKSFGAAAIQSNGNTEGLELTVAGKVTSVGEVAMYLPQVATCTIEGTAVISGATGIELRAGDLVVKDGASISAGDLFEAKANNNGSTVLGAAVAVSAHSTNLPINVTIEGGEFSSAYALYEVNFYENRTATTSLAVEGGVFNAPIYSQNCKGFITGGTFAEEVEVPAEYLAEGLIIDGNGEVVEKLIATLTKVTEGTIPAEGGVVKVKVTVSKDVTWVISHNNIVKKTGNTACDSEIEITINANETQQEVEHRIHLAAPANVSAAYVTYIQEAAAPKFVPEATEYGIVGEFNGWGNDVVLYTTETSGVLVAKNVTINAGGFKIRGKKAWTEKSMNIGFASANVKAATNTYYAFKAGDGNNDMYLATYGTYDVYLDLNGQCIALMTPGKAYSEAAVTGNLKNYSWGVAGSFQGWDATNPLEASKEGYWVVVKNVALSNGDEFKFVANKSWDVSYGSGCDVKVDQTYATYQGGKNMKFVGTAGAYDLYFSLVNNAFRMEKSK